MESTFPRNHDDHIVKKRLHSLTRYNLVHKFIPMLLAMKVRDAKAAVDKERDKVENTYQIGNVNSFIESKICSHRFSRMTLKMARRKQKLSLLSEKLMNSVDLGEATSFLDHKYFGCTERECKSNETIIDEDRSHSKTTAWSHDREGHAKKCVERYCELAHEKAEQRLYSILGRPPVHKGRTGNSCEVVKSLLSNRLEMLVLGSNLTFEGL